jgi:hypothetical protein
VLQGFHRVVLLNQACIEKCVYEQAIAALNHEKTTSLLFSVEAVGAAFFVVFLMAYYLGLPSTDNLVGDPTFRLLMQILGGLFLAMVASSLLAFIVIGRKK